MAIIEELSSVERNTVSLVHQLGTSSTNAEYGATPQSLFSYDLSFWYESARITWSFEVSNDAKNRGTATGLYIDGILVDNESRIEPKDSRNNYYQTKVFEYTFSPGLHTIEVRYGKVYGGGGSLANISNVRVFIDRVII